MDMDVVDIPTDRILPCEAKIKQYIVLQYLTIEPADYSEVPARIMRQINIDILKWRKRQEAAEIGRGPN